MTHCIVTLMPDMQAVQWGFDPGRICMPAVIFCTQEVAAGLAASGLPSHVKTVPLITPPALSTSAKLALMQQASEIHPAVEYCSWINADYLYSSLSFEYLYSDKLERALNTFANDLYYLDVPGYKSDAFFGGPVPKLEKVSALYENYVNSLLFESPGADIEKPETFRRAPVAEQHKDLNLLISSLTADEPVMHIIGDSHSLFCYTPGSIIGCRSNIFFRTADTGAPAMPYQYQYTHHIGSRTMYHTGREGKLEQYARDMQVKDGDALVLVFGEIDVRSHVMKQHYEKGRDTDEVISTLTGNYIGNILALRQQYGRLSIIVSAPIPPLDNPNYSSETLPVNGTIEERIALTRKINAALEAQCRRHNIGFISLNDLYETEKGDLKWEESDQFCHISHYYQGPAIERLYRYVAERQDNGVHPQRANHN